MSWDFYILKDKCPTCGRAEELYWRNYTSNMYPMLARANFEWDEIEGKSTKEAATALDRVIEELASNPDVYRPLQPSNGWGQYDTFLEALKELRKNCLENDGIFHVSR